MRQVHTRWLGVGVLSLGLVAASLMPVFAQEGQRGGQRGEGRQVDREAMQERMAEMRERQQERLRESLGMSQEEFEVVHPMIEQVQGYMREQQTAAGRGGRGGGFGRGGGDASSLSDEGQAVRDAAQALREAIASESIATEDLEQRLQALRDARSQLQASLQQARGELREVLTLQQEAVLVAQGILD